ncbi:YiiX/YebB-like N1pC/P60 family cysteine hydrolase [Thiorhodococcus drewsii]|uniref:YiiX/YebB-like N1pC/P60 family cysteine hydrolase n=1 Tax=Thiorhodococcus drewsii TaxID=210408 RepID=UPI0005951ACE|nr:YiiX/YebB-like N1pC/P60 family cysteine hydrolase [Thiorhodococcus drewsii]
MGTVVTFDVKSVSVGDLIFRRGRGLASDVARRFSLQEQRFSHVGIIVETEDGLGVVHSIADDAKGFDGVVVESISGFLEDARDWSAYRLAVSQEERNEIGNVALSMATKGIRFDNEYDLSTSDRLYCTELVRSVVNSALRAEFFTAKTHRMGRDFVSISDLYVDMSVQVLKVK